MRPNSNLSISILDLKVTRKFIALLVLVLSSACSSLSADPEHTLYLLEGTNDRNPNVYADCLGIVRNTLSSDQLAELLSNGGTVSRQGEDSKFEIDGKLERGRYICYTKLLIVKAPSSEVKSILDKNIEIYANKINAQKREYNKMIEEFDKKAKQSEIERKRIDSILESAF